MQYFALLQASVSHLVLTVESALAENVSVHQDSTKVHTVKSVSWLLCWYYALIRIVTLSYIHSEVSLAMCFSDLVDLWVIKMRKPYNPLRT